MKKFDIYLAEEYLEPDYYVAVSKSIFGKVKAELINFDIDSRGGLKIIHLGKKYNFHIMNAIKTLLFNNIKGDFIPIDTVPLDELKNDTLTISKKFYDILENKYLKYKEKYFLVDGVILKTKFDKVYNNPYYNSINYNYKILMS